MSSPALTHAKSAAPSPVPVSSPGEPPAHVQVIQMAIAIWLSRAIYAAARLGVADLLADGARSADELAQATGADAPSLHRLLRALASRGVFTEVEPRRFALTPLGAALKSGAPGAARAAVLTLAGDWQWKAWGEFLYSLQSGKPAMDKVWGMPLFEYLGEHPDDSACFGEAMVAMHGAEAVAVLAAYDFSELGSLADLGGGTGSLLAGILQAYPKMRGLVFDLPATVAAAKARIAAEGLAARCETQAGDFFKAVPGGYDGYLLSHVLHDWTDEQSVTILMNIRRAIAPDGRLLIVEIVLPQGDAPHHGKLLDLLMLTVPGGVERTAAEFNAVLAAAGFRIKRIIPTTTPQSIVEAIPD
jgi:SAM-dependent methyltransferase